MNLADVRTERADDGWALVFVRDLPHPPERVWSALTDPERLAAWAPYTADRDLGATGDATLTMIDGEVRQDLPATVTRAEPPAALEYTWGDSTLRWELAAVDGGTRLTLRQTVTDPDWVPKVAAGWHLCLDVAERLLDGDPVPPIRGRGALDHGWSELNTAYGERLGIPATDLPDA